jgi:hypothetical protein
MKIRAFVMPLVLAAGFGTAAIAAQGMGNGSIRNAPIPGQVEPDGGGGVAAGGSAQMFAVVDEDGTLVRSKGVLEVVRVFGGNYAVRTARNVRDCAYTATIGLSGAESTAAPGFITVVGEYAKPNGVYVQTGGFDGTQSDRPFHLYIDC